MGHTQWTFNKGRRVYQFRNSTTPSSKEYKRGMLRPILPIWMDEVLPEINGKILLRYMHAPVRSRAELFESPDALST